MGSVFSQISASIRYSSSKCPWGNTPEKVYMSRSLLPKHRDLEFGFEALDDFFKKNGYTVLYPEKIPLSQLIQYIRNAEVVATVSEHCLRTCCSVNRGKGCSLWSDAHSLTIGSRRLTV